MKVLLADDHDLFRDGMHQLIDNIVDCQILEANSFSSLSEQCSLHNDINLLLLDLDMPGSNGLIDTLSLRKTLPDTLIIVVSGIESIDVVSAVLEAGFQGYIPKSCSSNIIKNAIELVLSGGIYIPPVTLSLLKRTDNKSIIINTRELNTENSSSLTKRELVVLSHLAKGSSNKVIAKELGISATTVRTHTVSIYRTLNVNNRTEAGHIASKLGLI